MANISIYPGSSSFFPGTTPFGFYDYDLQFQLDADRVALFCAQRLGWPIVEIELQDKNFYTAFEEAVTTYGNELYAYKIKQDYLSLEGAPTSSNLNHTLITPNYGGMVRLSKQYGEEAGAGGNVTYYRGAISASAGVQDYDLSAWAVSQSITGGIEIKRIYYEQDPAIVRSLDPTGLLSSTVWGGNISLEGSQLMMPLSYTLQRIQAIEMNSQVLRSNYSFELVNNKLRIFPIPETGSIDYIFFQYVKLSERNDPSAGVTGSALVTNVSNVPFTNPVYSQINSIGRQWIFEYTLALVKEMLGYVRGKYTQIPIPGAEVQLNQQDLLSSAANDKVKLREKLQAYFDETSRNKILERTSQEADFQQKINGNIPLTIYIG